MTVNKFYSSVQKSTIDTVLISVYILEPDDR